MSTETKFELVATKQFGDVAFDCYQEESYNGSAGIGTEFWATREQIGRLLGYADPRIAIAKIHNRNKERLDKFSRGYQLGNPSGGTQMTTVYSFKGLLEICRYSDQPNANAVIDCLWEIADEIRRTGRYESKMSSPSLSDQTGEINKLKACVAKLQATVEDLQAQVDRRTKELKWAKTENARLAGRVRLLECPQEFETPPDLIGENGLPVYSVTIEDLAKILSNLDPEQIREPVDPYKLYAWLRKNDYLCTDEVFFDLPTTKSFNFRLFIYLYKEHQDPASGALLSYHETRATPRAVQFFGNMRMRGERFDPSNPMNFYTERRLLTVNTSC